MKSRIATKSTSIAILSFMVLTLCLMTGCGSNSDTAQNSGENTTKEEAESVALEAAGFTADSVTGLRTEYEVDDSVPKYEVQFYHENTEYDYDIHAQTGEILSYDVDTPND